MASNTLRFHRISRGDFNSNTTRTYNRGDLYFIYESNGVEGVIYMCKTTGQKSSATFEQYSLVSHNHVVETTWSNLKSLRDSSQLVPGTQYRITDYVATTTQNITTSANHQFDIIVVADSTNKLNESAKAIQHRGDTYFTNNDCNLNAWELKYCLDNDTDRFMWANTSNGKGVIYWMKDDWNNECSYDFKNIMFKRTLNDGEYDPDGNDTWVYTFNWTDANGNTSDLSVEQFVHPNSEGSYSNTYRNIIREWRNDDNGNYGPLQLNNIVFLSSENYSGGVYLGCYCNTFGNNCFCNTFGNSCNENTFGNNCFYNTFGNNCCVNTFGFGCHDNIFGVFCCYNTFGVECGYNTFRYECYDNILGNECYGNTLGDWCEDNIFGDECSNNTFDEYNCNGNTFGDGCGDNTFGNNCYNNTFGDGCSYNTFGYSCSENTFGYDCWYNEFGDYCGDNTFGYYCYNNTFGYECGYNTFGYECRYNTFGTGCRNNTFENNCGNNTFGNSTNVKSYYQNISLETGINNTYIDTNNTTTSSSPLQNITIKKGISGSILLTCPTNINYEWKVAKNTSGEIKQYCEADLIN